MVLIEELDIEDSPAHPWTSPTDAGFDDSDPHTLNNKADDIEGYYRAGLHTLSDAVFGDPQLSETVTHTATRVHHRQAITRGRSERGENTDQVIVRRELGSQVAYDSIWAQRQGSSTPLRYRFSSTSADASGHAIISFHSETDVNPTDHLTCAGLMDAIVPTQESAPGILHHDLEINHVKSDDRLAR